MNIKRYCRLIPALLLGTMLQVTGARAADITIAYAADPVTMDPNERLTTGALQMAHLVFDALVRFDSKLQIEPRLAKRWEWLDDRRLRLHLRRDVKFHSGNTMSADDVIFSFDRIRNSPDFKALFTSYQQMVKVDEYTVDLIHNQIFPLTLQSLAYVFVLDKAFYTGLDAEGKAKDRITKDQRSFATTHESGSGPFVYAFREQGVKNVFHKFDDYWAERGNVDSITLVPIKENATRLAALLSGDVDFITPVSPTNFNRVEQSRAHTLYTQDTDRIITIQMNQKVVPQFRDVRVRQAVVHAINNEGIAKKIMRGFATPAGQTSPRVYLGHDETLTPRYDLKKARQLMQEAGYANGFSVDMISPNNRYVNDEKISQAVVAMLAKIKIKVNLTTMPKAQYWGEFDRCAAGLQMMGWSSDTSDSANYSQFLTMTRDNEAGTGSYNCGYFSNSTLDALVRESNKTLDSSKRALLLKQIANIEYNQAALIPLHWQNNAWGYTTRFKNFPQIVNLQNLPNFGDLIVK